MFALQNIENLRSKMIGMVKNTPADLLNKIPIGFNNNIVWNFGHVVVTGYALVFKVTGVDPDIQIPYLEKFGKGTKPETPVSAEEIEALIELSNRFADTVKTAMSETDRFKNIKEYTTGTFGVPNKTIDELLVTIAMHETVHWQIMRDYTRILGS